MTQMFSNGDQEVSMVEQGTLKIIEFNLTLSASTGYTTLTPPAGKKYRLKGITTSASTGSYTVSGVDVTLKFGSLDQTLSSALTPSGGFQKTSALYGDQNLIIDSTMQVFVFVSTSSFTTTGVYKVRALVMESE